MKRAMWIYCERDRVYSASFRYRRELCGKSVWMWVKARGNRVKGSWGVHRGAGGGAGWGRARGHSGTPSKRSHLLVLAQGFFSAKLWAHFTHHSSSTHKSHQTPSNYYTDCVPLSMYQSLYPSIISEFEFLWVVCIISVWCKSVVGCLFLCVYRSRVLPPTKKAHKLLRGDSHWKQLLM